MLVDVSHRANFQGSFGVDLMAYGRFGQNQMSDEASFFVLCIWQNYFVKWG